MRLPQNISSLALAVLAALVASSACACRASEPSAAGAANSSGASPAGAAQLNRAWPSAAPPASQTGGFDGAKAYTHVGKLVGFGPHPPGSPAIAQVQTYIQSQLTGFGC